MLIIIIIQQRITYKLAVIIFKILKILSLRSWDIQANVSNISTRCLKNAPFLGLYVE